MIYDDIPKDYREQLPQREAAPFEGNNLISTVR